MQIWWRYPECTVYFVSECFPLCWKWVQNRNKACDWLFGERVWDARSMAGCLSPLGSVGFHFVYYQQLNVLHCARERRSETWMWCRCFHFGLTSWLQPCKRVQLWKNISHPAGPSFMENSHWCYDIMAVSLPHTLDTLLPLPWSARWYPSATTWVDLQHSNPPLHESASVKISQACFSESASCIWQVHWVIMIGDGDGRSLIVVFPARAADALSSSWLCW